MAVDIALVASASFPPRNIRRHAPGGSTAASRPSATIAGWPDSLVRKERLELSRVTPLEPKSSASTNSATFAEHHYRNQRRRHYTKYPVVAASGIPWHDYASPVRTARSRPACLAAYKPISARRNHVSALLSASTPAITTTTVHCSAVWPSGRRTARTPLSRRSASSLPSCAVVSCRITTNSSPA